MTPSLLCTTGLVLTVAAAVLLMLNMLVDSTTGMFWIGIPLMIVGLACIAASERGGRK